MELDLRKEESQLSKAACFGLELTSLNVFHFVTFNFCLSEFLFFTVSTLYLKTSYLLCRTIVLYCMYGEFCII